MSQMAIIDPVSMTDAILVSSTVPETDYAAWSNVTNYGQGAHAIRGHRRWESLQPSNTGNDPLTSPTWWVDMGPTNRWAMFDDSVGTLTTGTSEIEVVIAPGRIDAIALLDVDADTVELTMTVDGDVVFNQTQTTQIGGQAITNWYLYFTAPIGRVSTILFENLPIYENCVVTITATSTAPGGPLAIGTMAVGRLLSIGVVETGAKAGINDFSQKTTDKFGQTRFIQRSYAKRASLRLKIADTSLDLVFRTLAELRAKPIVWIASRRFDCLVIYGAWKSFEFDIQFGPNSYFSLDLEGLI